MGQEIDEHWDRMGWDAGDLDNLVFCRCFLLLFCLLACFAFNPVSFLFLYRFLLFFSFLYCFLLVCLVGDGAGI